VSLPDNALSYPEAMLQSKKVGFMVRYIFVVLGKTSSSHREGAGASEDRD